MEVTAEERERNEVLHLEEVDVLESIYGGEMSRDARGNIHLRVLPDVVADYDNELAPSDVNSLYASIEFTLPPSYPSHSPPTVSINAEWLGRDAARAVQEELVRKFYEEGSGEGVLFQWAEWYVRMKCCAYYTEPWEFPIPMWSAASTACTACTGM